MYISIAIISYNAENHIKQCLDSCLSQTYKDLDIVIVDDNSSDNTVNIIKEYQQRDNRINLVVHEKNKSALQARRTAVKHAKYDYVWFIDSDDRIEDVGAIGYISRFIKGKEFPDMVCFGSNDYHENGEFKRKFFDWGRDKSIEEWKYDSDFRPYTRVTRKKVLEKAVSVIPDDFYLYRHNDLFMFCLVKFCVETKEFIDKAFYRYTLSTTSVTNKVDNESIDKHINLLQTLMADFREVALNLDDLNVDIDKFVISEQSKLMKYAYNQYKVTPISYLYTLKKFNKSNKDIIISLTTYSKRIDTVDKVIISLLNQNIAVDKIILWLDEDEFRLEELPVSLINLLSNNFEIKFCKNYKSYKKLIPTLKIYPHATIITFDDDIEYPKDQVEKLLLQHFEHPACVVANVARNIIVKNDQLQPYSTWFHAFEEQVNVPLLNLLPIGVGGVLYPSGSLNDEVFNSDQFMTLAPHSDDLWFKAMSLMNNRKVVVTGAGYKIGHYQISGTADIGLWQSVNEGTDSNFEQLSNVISAYVEVGSKVFNKNFSSYQVDIDDLVKLYRETAEFRKKLKDSQLNKKLLNIIRSITLNSRDYESFSSENSSELSSPFKSANEIFLKGDYFHAHLIYHFLYKKNPEFKYYYINCNKARLKLIDEYGGDGFSKMWSEMYQDGFYSNQAMGLLKLVGIDKNY